MPSPWNDANDRKLLLIIIHLGAFPPSWDDVTAAMGQGFTKEACRQHFQKMRKEAASHLPSAAAIKNAKGPVNGKSSDVDEDADNVAKKKRKLPTKKKTKAFQRDEADSSEDEFDDEELIKKQFII